MPAPLRLRLGVRRDARPGSRQFQGRPLRNVRACRSALPPRHERDRDDMDDASGMVAGCRCAHDQRLARRGSQHQPHAPTHRFRRRPPARAGRRVYPRTGAGRDGVRADARLWRDRRRVEHVEDEYGHGLDATDGVTAVQAVQRHPHGHRGQPCPFTPHDERGREALLRASPGPGSCVGRARSKRPRSTSSAPVTSGAPGSPKATTPSTPGARTCSARHSP